MSLSIMSCKDYFQQSPSTDILALETLKSIVDIISGTFKGITEKIHILDVGCGVGSISIPLSYIGYKVTGIDIHKKTIDHVRQINKFDNATYLTVDGTEFKSDRTYDVVLCIGVLEHVADYNRILQNIKNNMNNNSIAIVNVPNGYSIYEILFSRLSQILNFDKLFFRLPEPIYKALTGSSTPRHSLNIANPHIHFFSFGQFVKILRQNGFQCVGVKNLGLGIFLDWWWMRILKKIECDIAPFVPSKIAGSWNFVVKLN